MRFQYLDPRLHPPTLDERWKLLNRVFRHLLIQEDGDVEASLRLLKMIGERHGLFDDDLTFEDFRKRIQTERLATPDAQGRLALTPRGERVVRAGALEEIFTGLKMGRPGDHRTPHSGQGSDRTAETRPYSFGDDVADIDFRRSFQNALFRSGGEGALLQEEDLEVHEVEHHTSMATVLLLDISHSMVLYGEDRITPAKRVALALTELILTRYPHDALHVVLFGDEAREISVRELTYAGVGPYHTNTHAGLQLARKILLRKKHINKQVFMITDGKPTVLFDGDQMYRNTFGLDPRIINKTLDEASECRRHGITITTFMLAQDPALVQFVEELTRVNRGRAFFASADRLETAVFVDFIRNRQRRI